MDDKKELIIYETKQGLIEIQFDLDNETAWLSLDRIAELFQRDKSTISRHIKNIFEEDELDSSSVVANFATTATDGKIYQVDHYNLDMIISIGYRVNSAVATKFRKWATQTLKEYIIKGFVLNSERLKNPSGWDYFDELLEKIREIRASEKRFYQKVRDLFALSVDYKDDLKTSNDFFAEVQNKLLHAVCGNTAAELIVNRSDAEKPNMNLTNWKGSKVRKGDVVIAKNYLTQDEIKELDSLVVMFLDYAENQAKRRRQLKISDWKEKINNFITFNDYELLTGKGSISHDKAKNIAEGRYDKFDSTRKTQEAIEADKQDIKELEEIEVKMLENKKVPPIG
ncbi:2-hydroxyacid dehydrogenase [Candidatus Gastranaerophilus sp. (ex Termes propinquus)]|nr:2-hydroxyacid dehydrogenase [Candidatus Gastranaerophilus sp. (ex Termes propinquus)]